MSVFLGADALGSIGATSSVQFLVLGFCIGCCAGFVISVAQSYGAGEKALTEKYIVNGILVSAVLSLLITAACVASVDTVIRMLRIADYLADGAKKYLVITFYGIPCTFAYNLSAGILRSCGNSKQPFFYLLCSSAVNIILDLLFVAVFGFGIRGAAVATVISQGLSAFLCFRYIYLHRFLSEGCMRHLGDRKTGLHLIAMGIPTGLQYSITAIGTIIVQSTNNALGGVFTTAYFTGSKIRQLFMCPFDAIATGASVFAAQNFGAHNKKRVDRGVRCGVVLGVSYGLGAGLVMLLFARTFASVLLGADQMITVSETALYLRSVGAFFWLLGILNVLRMCIQGLGYTKLALGSGITELAARIALCIFVVPVYGYRGICLNEPAAWVWASVYVIIIYSILKIKLRLKDNDRI